MAILKGQNFRILVGDNSGGSTVFKCIGMATNCTVTLTNNTEDASTKDDTGMSSKPTMTSQAWSVSVESLSVADVGAMLTAIKNLTKFKLVWDETSTTANQTGRHATFGHIGDAYLNDATFQFDDRTNAQKSLQFTGCSALAALTDEPYATITAGSYTKGQFVRLLLSSDNTTAPAAVIAAALSLSLHVSLQMELQGHGIFRNLLDSLTTFRPLPSFVATTPSQVVLQARLLPTSRASTRLVRP